MKLKLFTLLTASLIMAVSGQDKVKKPIYSEPKVVTADTTIAASIAPILKRFDGEKYAPTQLVGDPDHYIIYFTASW